MTGFKLPWRKPRLAVVVALMAVLAAGAVAYAATEPAIQTFTPRSEKQITNIDVLRQQIRNYYGDPLGTGTFAADSSYAREAEGVASDASKRLSKKIKWHKGGMPAIVLDVDDTSLATWNYEIFSNWAYNPVTNASYVTSQLFPAVPGMVAMATKAAARGLRGLLPHRPTRRAGAATLGNLTADGIGVDAGYPAPTALANGEDGLFTKPAIADYPAISRPPAPATPTAHARRRTTSRPRARTSSRSATTSSPTSATVQRPPGGFADTTFKLPNPNYFLP